MHIDRDLHVVSNGRTTWVELNEDLLKEYGMWKLKERNIHMSREDFDSKMISTDGLDTFMRMCHKEHECVKDMCVKDNTHSHPHARKKAKTLFSSTTHMHSPNSTEAFSSGVEQYTRNYALAQPRGDDETSSVASSSGHGVVRRRRKGYFFNPFAKN